MENRVYYAYLTYLTSQGLNARFFALRSISPKYFFFWFMRKDCDRKKANIMQWKTIFSIVSTHSIYRTIEEEKHPNCHFTTNTWTKKYILHVPHAIHFMGKHIFLLSKMGGNPFSFSEMGYGNHCLQPTYFNFRTLK